MKTDQQLLTEYHRAGAEAAFAEFVARHIGWVYSAALRIVVDRHLAEDVTQRVFVAIARHAATLARRSAVAGWLHRTTHNFAVMTVRTEERRRAREQKAMATAIPSGTDPVWDTVAPQLDDAIAWLVAQGLNADASRAMQLYADYLAASFPAEAMTWARSIPDAQTRQKALDRVTKRIRELHPNVKDEG